jgi:hypothetical protein
VGADVDRRDAVVGAVADPPGRSFPEEGVLPIGPPIHEIGGMLATKLGPGDRGVDGDQADAPAGGPVRNGRPG